MSRPVSLLLAGYAGFGNVGDDLIAETVAERLSRIDPAPEIHLQTGPAPAKSLFAIPGVRITKRRGSLLTRALLPLLPRLDGIVYAGGSLFHGYRLRSLLSYAAPALLARLAGRRRAFFGQGIGPLRSRMQERIVALAMDGADSVGVRDERSFAELGRIGVRAPHPELHPDPVRALFQPGRVKPRDASPGARKIALNLREPPSGLAPFDGAAILRGIVESEGAFAYLVALEPGDEALHASAVAALPAGLRERTRTLSAHKPAPDLLAALAALDGGVGERLHFHLLCHMAGVPTVALAYDPKVAALFRDAALAEYAVPNGPGHAVRALRLLSSLLERRAEASAALLDRAKVRAVEARAALDRLAARVAAWGEAS